MWRYKQMSEELEKYRKADELEIVNNTNEIAELGKRIGHAYTNIAELRGKFDSGYTTHSLYHYYKKEFNELKEQINTVNISDDLIKLAGLNRIEKIEEVLRDVIKDIICVFKLKDQELDTFDQSLTKLDAPKEQTECKDCEKYNPFGWFGCVGKDSGGEKKSIRSSMVDRSKRETRSGDDSKLPELFKCKECVHNIIESETSHRCDYLKPCTNNSGFKQKEKPPEPTEKEWIKELYKTSQYWKKKYKELEDSGGDRFSENRIKNTEQLERAVINMKDEPREDIKFLFKHGRFPIKWGTNKKDEKIFKRIKEVYRIE